MDNDPNKGLREPLKRFNLPTEPWLFVVGADGRVTARLEGSFGLGGLRAGAQDRPVITVFAHGLVQRSSLPIPEWLFGWAAAIVLVRVVRRARGAVAAAAARGRGLAAAARRRSGACSARRGVEFACGVIGVAVLALVLTTGYAGPDDAAATTSRRPSSSSSSGSGWCSRACCSATSSARSTRGGRSARVLLARRARARPYPERLGRWPAAVGLFGLHLDRAGVGLGRGAAPRSPPRWSVYTRR